jgi:hypothetical protein
MEAALLRVILAAGVPRATERDGALIEAQVENWESNPNS